MADSVALCHGKLHLSVNTHSLTQFHMPWILRTLPLRPECKHLKVAGEYEPEKGATGH